jgi:hypothetical protein
LTTSQQSNWTVLDHILKGLSRSRPGDPKAPTHWPSEASALIEEDGKTKVVGQCRRQAYFRFLKDAVSFHEEGVITTPEAMASLALVNTLKEKEIPPNPYLRFIWSAGELYEEYIVQQSMKNGIFVHGQVPIYIRSHNVSGKLDLVVVNPETGKLSIVEVKSVFGYNGDFVLGSDTDRRKGRLGTPRDKNLMQIAVYDWWFASTDSAYEHSRLVYGARDTGKFAEYLIKTERDDETGITHIYYKGMTPCKTEWVQSPITIDSILEQYAYVADHIASHKVPPRDFKLAYDYDDLKALYAKGELTKAETAQWEKILEREAENIERVASGQKPKVDLKLPDKGDYNCRLCPFKNVCYSEEGTPLEL